MEVLDVSLAEVTSAIARISEITCPPYQTVRIETLIFNFGGFFSSIGRDLRCFGFSCVWLGAFSNGATDSNGAHGWSPFDAPQRARRRLVWWYPIWGFDRAGWSCRNWQNTGTVLWPIWLINSYIQNQTYIFVYVSGWFNFSTAVLPEACIIGFIAAILWRFRWSCNIYRCRIQVQFNKVSWGDIDDISYVVAKSFPTMFVKELEIF